MDRRILRRLRDANGRGQAEVAKAVAISPAYLARLEATGRPTRERLLWLSRRAHGCVLHRCVETITLDQLEDSRRPLLFSLLPRMLRRDGGAPESLQGAFGYIDQGRGRAPAMIVSGQRWSRALATSRTLAARRMRGRKP